MLASKLIIISGKPYSGKSSLSRELSKKKYGSSSIRSLPMGERLRAIGSGKIHSHYSEMLARNTNALKQHMPVPKEAALGVFEEFITKNAGSLIILDGFPRYPDRLEGFEQSLSDLNASVVAVCRIDIDDETVYKRSEEREQRYSDVPEDFSFVERRLLDYKQNMLPTLNELSKKYPLYILSGTEPIATNLTKILDIIKTETIK